MIDVEFAQASDAGRVREHNEDYFGYVEPGNAAREQTHGWLFALADGVGGQEQGELASRTAVESLLAGFLGAAPGQELRSLLPDLVQKANVKVFETGLAAKPGGSAMATTLVCCALRLDRAVVSHVGDSRCYLVRQGAARALTRDHTVASGGRNLLTRSLGHGMFVAPETSEHLLFPGDVLLLCSDGLHGALSAAELAATVCLHAALDTTARELIAAANERDGGDNVSVQLIRIKSVARAGMYRGRLYKLG